MDYPSLYKKLERTLATIEESPDIRRMLESLLEHIVDAYRHDLGFSSGRLYELDGDRYHLVRVVGDGVHPAGFSLPLDYAPLVQVRDHGYVSMTLSDPGVRSDIEAALGVDHFAAICFGPRKEYVVSFTLADDQNRDGVLYSLNAVRHVCDMKIRQRRMERVLLDAREIQQNLFKPPPGTFSCYEIGARSRPAELVGGDVSVFIPVSDDVMAFAVGDVAGHGLSAALQARDVVVGLMMGVSENLKMVATIERLNRVIHETSIASKFVTLFYGEIESSGNLIYINAGHNPALLLREDATSPKLLRRGGMVLGPNPRARYQRGFSEIRRGDVLAVYTDGVTEAEDGHGEMYGLERLGAVIAAHRARPATEIVDEVFADLERFTGSTPQGDDRTLVIMRRVRG